MLQVKNLKVNIEGKQILKGIDLTIKPGEIHAVMGPNGAGKTTLAMALMGQPSYEFKNQISRQREGSPLAAKFKIYGKDMFGLTPEERAKNGLFVAFQQPIEVAGVSFLSFLRTACKAINPNEKMPIKDFKESVKKAFVTVGLDEEFMYRNVNEGFSGGEKKRAEIAQLLVLRPKFVVLDEIDSGLDIDSLRAVAKTIVFAVKKFNLGMLVITHYQRILHHLKPDYVHILIDGKIKRSGGMQLVNLIEKNGYAAV